MSGIDVAQRLGDRCHIVFVTAYDEYAVAAFEEGAVDYVLKPVTTERMAKIVTRVKARLATPPLDLSALLTRLAEREGAATPLKWIRASLGSIMQMIAVTDVVYFQAEDKYTKVVTADGDALIVNLRAIARVERDWRDQPVITLRSRPEKLTVSRTFAHRFKSM